LRKQQGQPPKKRNKKHSKQASARAIGAPRWAALLLETPRQDERLDVHLVPCFTRSLQSPTKRLILDARKTNSSFCLSARSRLPAQKKNRKKPSPPLSFVRRLFLFFFS
jgi:hypothetical protein